MRWGPPLLKEADVSWAKAQQSFAPRMPRRLAQLQWLSSNLPETRRTRLVTDEGLTFLAVGGAAADFQAISTGVFEKGSVVVWLVFRVEHRPFDIFSASGDDDLRNPVDLLLCFGPERKARGVGAVGRIFNHTDELRCGVVA